MTTVPYRFYARVLLVTGLPVGLVVFFLDLRDAQASMTDILTHVGLVALGACVFFVVLYRHAMRQRDPGYTLADASPHQTATLTLPVAVEDALDLCLAALEQLPGFTTRQLQRDQGAITGVTAGRAGSWLSRSRVVVRVRAVSAMQSEVWVESAFDALLCRLALDYGTNRDIVNGITTRINEQLARRFEAQRQATERADTQRALTEARLSALQAHIEPHFLYNTLASVQLLTRSDPPRADAMLGHLITYLRGGLTPAVAAPGGVNSTVGREVARSVAYLEILKIRMGSRLTVTVDVPEALAACAFPAMMVQTLVENAIKHGLEAKPGGGTIAIQAARQGHQLVLTVCDDGLGPQEGGSGSGLGLRNIRERLQLAYGDQAALRLTNNTPAGMVASICVPDVRSLTSGA